MTPSEIDDTLRRYSIRTFTQAAATIREFEVRVGGLQETIKRQANSSADQLSRVLDRAEAAEANLKIATEALDLIRGYAEHDEGCDLMDFGSGDKCDCGLEDALARIKEGGDE